MTYNLALRKKPSTANVTAGRNDLAQSLGFKNPTVTANHNPVVRSAGSETGSVTATTGSAASISLATSKTTVNAPAGDAFAFAFGDSQNHVTAGQSAGVLTMGSFQGTVDADQDASVYAVDGISNSSITSSNGYAGAVSWGNALPVVVDGKQDAVVWANGPLSGQVRQQTKVTGTKSGQYTCHTQPHHSHLLQIWCLSRMALS